MGIASIGLRASAQDGFWHSVGGLIAQGVESDLAGRSGYGPAFRFSCRLRRSSNRAGLATRLEHSCPLSHVINPTVMNQYASPLTMKTLSLSLWEREQ